MTFCSLSLRLLALGKASCHTMRTFRQPCRGAHGARNWSLPPAATCISHLGNRSSSPRKAFRWLQLQLAAWLKLHKTPWARTTKLRNFWISDTENHEIINIGSFKLLNSGITGYSAIYIKYCICLKKKRMMIVNEETKDTVKEDQQLNKKKINLIYFWAKDLNRHFSKEDI